MLYQLSYAGRPSQFRRAAPWPSAGTRPGSTPAGKKPPKRLLSFRYPRDTHQGGVIRTRVQSRLIRSLIATALAGIGSLAIATAAPASVPKGFFGLGGEPLPSSNPSWAQIAGVGVHTWKAHLRWAYIEPYAPSGRSHTYYWSTFDNLVAQAAQVGIRVVPTLWSSPQWASGCSHIRCPDLKSDKGYPTDDWKEFVAAAVRRYGPCPTENRASCAPESFWRLHTELTGEKFKPIKDWQVWQEPNFHYFWHGDVSARQYGRFLTGSSRAINAENPTAKVVMAGLPEVIDGTPMVKFLRNVYRKTPSVRGYFDYAALHPFASTRSRVRYAIERSRSVMSRYGDGGKWLFITEFGWSTGGPNVPFRTTVSGQRKKLKRTYRMFVKHRRQWRISRAMWVFAKDVAGQSGWPAYTGLYYSNGQPKPSWSGYQETTDKYLP